MRWRLQQAEKRLAMLILLVLQLLLAACGTQGTATPTPTVTPKPVATLMVGKLVDLKLARPGDVLYYTLVVMNDQLRGDDPGTHVQLADPLPAELELVPGSLSADARYDADSHTILWSGQVPRGLSVDVSFQARLTSVEATMSTLTNTVTVTDAFGRVRESSAVTPIEVGQPWATPTVTPTITSGDCTDVAPFAQGCLDLLRPPELAPDVELVGVLPAGPVTVAAWSPDGRCLAVVAMALDPQEGGLWVVRTDGPPEEHHLGQGSNPVWSPDGRWLAFTGAPQGGQWQPWLAEVETWNLRPLALPSDAYLADWISSPAQ